MIDITPSSDGFARIGRRFAEQILEDVKKSRKADDRKLLVEMLKIAAHIEKRDLARLLVALEQNESVAIMPEVVSKPTG